MHFQILPSKKVWLVCPVAFEQGLNKMADVMQMPGSNTFISLNEKFEFCFKFHSSLLPSLGPINN